MNNFTSRYCVGLALLAWWQYSTLGFTADGKLFRGTNQWQFTISKVEQVEPSREDFKIASNIRAKWLISTRLKNTSRKGSFLLAYPYYIGSVSGDFEPDSVVGGSRMPLNSKEQFVFLPPGKVIEARHVVFAEFDAESGKYTISGSFIGNVPNELKQDALSRNWRLRKTLVDNEFSLSMALFDWCPAGAAEALGADFDNLWRGKVLTKPVKLSVTASLDAEKPIKKSEKADAKLNSQ